MPEDMTTVSQVSCDLVFDNLHRQLSAWEDAQREVEFILPEDQLEDEINAAADFKETVDAAKVELLTTWVAAHAVTTPGADDAASVSGSNKNGLSVRLPKLEMPK